MSFEVPVLCPFRICTGYACMGCGLTRSVISLARGDLDLSLRYHPLGVAFVSQALVFAVALIAVSVLRPQTTVNELLAKSQVLIWANVALLGTVWVVRWRLGLLDFVVAS